MHSEKVRQTRAHDELGVVLLSRAVQFQHFSLVAVEEEREGERERGRVSEWRKEREVGVRKENGNGVNEEGEGKMGDSKVNTDSSADASKLLGSQ